MSEYQFGKLTLDPVANPAVLDMATWDAASAWECLRAVAPANWPTLPGRGKTAGVTLLPGSRGKYAGSEWGLVQLGDGQHVLLAVGAAPVGEAPGTPLGELAISDGLRLTAYPADAAALAWLLQHVLPGRGPKALGPVPRLGIGTRMSAAVWPGIWPALTRCGVAANVIQNSVRELNMLDDLRAGRPARGNYMFGFGTLYEGHTGSTFEGLWLAGVLAALRADYRGPFGADADHIMVKRGPDGLERARQVITAARHYTFFTLDVSDVLNYAALNADTALDTSALPQGQEWRDALSFHLGQGGPLNEEMVTRAAAKHWVGLNAVQELSATLRQLKGETPFDLELSIDETPPEIRALDCLTTEAEILFLLGEIRRRGLPVTHIAPNFGVEKGADYLGTDGLPGLEARVRALHHLAREQGILLDCHSGDDLSAATRRVVGRATGGQVHFKISPMLQELFAHTLHDCCPDRFGFWWEDTLAYATREAEAGSALAVRCLQEYEAAGTGPSPAHTLFHYYGFASVGRRDDSVRFLLRDRFYSLPEAMYAEYARRVERLLCEVIEDVLRGA